MLASLINHYLNVNTLIHRLLCAFRYDWQQNDSITQVLKYFNFEIPLQQINSHFCSSDWLILLSKISNITNKKNHSNSLITVFSYINFFDLVNMLNIATRKLTKYIYLSFEELIPAPYTNLSFEDLV